MGRASGYARVRGAVMPTYVYRCASCGTTFEKVQSYDDAPVRACDKCGKAVRRVIQRVGVVFRGDGWYCKDKGEA